MLPEKKKLVSAVIFESFTIAQGPSLSKLSSNCKSPVTVPITYIEKLLLSTTNNGELSIELAVTVRLPLNSFTICIIFYNVIKKRKRDKTFKPYP